MVRFGLLDDLGGGRGCVHLLRFHFSDDDIYEFFFFRLSPDMMTIDAKIVVLKL